MSVIPTQPFGRTGHDSTRIIFGAAAFSGANQDDADRAMELVIQSGINHIDTAAGYGDSELRLGPWMETHRNDFFLATKTGERTFQPAYDQIRTSLERLRTDHVDLIQLHYLVDPTEWETAMAPGGALEAVIRARDEGLARFIGVTGHDVPVAAQHKRALERFDFDSVLLPYNYPMMQNPRYAADFEALVALCQQRNVAVQTIKAITAAPWGDRTPTTTTWYEPLVEQDDIDLAVHWVLGRPGVFLNTAADLRLLPKILSAAERFQSRPTDEMMQQLVETRSMEPMFV
jgi:aryl-alcohol dehydrogenase-like predicted oxidoreductase